MIRKRIQISGRVQGVGARPFFVRVARRHGLAGYVRNDAQGVTLEVQGQAEDVEAFERELSGPVGAADWPVLMRVQSVAAEPVAVVEGEREFRIIESEAGGSPVVQVTPDTAVCGDCLREMNDPADFRFRYPFINCTQCGPRYSIIRAVPYDRPYTTMAAFAMCERCRAQYEDMADRRFHAQPVACPVCGPHVRLTDAEGKVLEEASDAAIARAARMLREGQIVAIKGIGGFHLAVDARSEEAVQTLRRRKGRQGKPFAMMAGSMEAVRAIAEVSKEAEAVLNSPEAPIVLLPKKKDNKVAPSVAAGTNAFGVMLPYAPLHHLLFAAGAVDLLVMTSANFSEEPLICDNAEALERLGTIADAFLMHNRDIYRQVDDSVVHLIDGEPAFLRRARGYVPAPILRGRPAKREIFAAGADLKNTFCFVKGRQYLLSEHIGDLAEGRAYRHYRRSAKHLRQLFEVRPTVAACDLHPGYLSTQFAKSLEVERLVEVQHHWAHIASALAEANAEPDRRVIGLAADGTGYGTDGAVWGGECLIASLRAFERIGHLAYFPLAGGDAAARQTVRPLAGILRESDRLEAALELAGADREAAERIALQIERGINTALTSSMGRLFDAAGALIGAGRENGYEAQVPMALEAMAREGVEEAYPVEIAEDAAGVMQWQAAAILEAVVDDLRRGQDRGITSARFHNTAAAGLLEMARRARQRTGLNEVALSGGVFCNRYLTNRLIRRLRAEGFTVLFKRQVPVNDGGIALGQAAVAAALDADL
jgi:hydrogenase maturation protein HypF